MSVRPSPRPVGEAARNERVRLAYPPRAHPRRNPLPGGEGVAGRFSRRVWRKFFQLRLALVDRRKYERVVLEDVVGLPIVVLPDVFNPKLLRSGEFLVHQLPQFPAGTRVLDLGCGSGVAAIMAARQGAQVVAVDINPAAVRCTRVNTLLNDVAVDLRQGDLFAPIQGERFDVVLFNPPYYRGVPRGDLDRAWRSPDIIERFALELADHLAPAGHALLVLSSDGEQAAFLQALAVQRFSYTTVAKRDFLNEQMTVYRIQPC